jgi:hypothetical protein
VLKNPSYRPGLDEYVFACPGCAPRVRRRIRWLAVVTTMLVALLVFVILFLAW